MFERFSEKAIKSIMKAQDEARRMGYNHVGTEQMLLGILCEGSSIAAECLKKANVTLDALRKQVEKLIGRGDEPQDVEIPFTPRAKKVLETAWNESRRLGHNFIGTEHLLIGLLVEVEGVGAQALTHMGSDLAALRESVEAELVETYPSDPPA